MSALHIGQYLSQKHQVFNADLDYNQVNVILDETDELYRTGWTKAPSRKK